jgi:adenylate kinase
MKIFNFLKPKQAKKPKTLFGLPERQQEKIFSEAAREANEMQRDLMERYERVVVGRR